MDFTLPQEVEQVRKQIKVFVDREIVPYELDPSAYDDHENIDEVLLKRLRKKARAEGLWALSMPKNRGGREFDAIGMAACYEEMGRSIFGPVVFNAAAPDDGNMYVLNKIGTESQKKKWLQPIIDGDVRSSITMTEPHPGAGSDPAGMMRTTATKNGNNWLIKGRKWYTTGADGAAHFLLLARTSNDARRGLTAFMFHKDQPGWRIVRRIPIMGPEEHGGHCELEFDGLEVADEDIILDLGYGLKVVQIRLGMARLTHCMRWLGMAKRALQISDDYVREREAFGSKLRDRESIQLLQGAAAKEVMIGRLLVMNAAWKLDRGDFARSEVSAAKIHVADALHQCIDTSIQLCGSKGYSKDTILEWMYRYARQARIVDGASEVHKMVLSKAFQREGIDFWSWAHD